MCGIAGIVQCAGLRSEDRPLLQAMNDSLAHRGPDGEGTFFDDSVALGHRRLAIIDLNSGQQPIFNEDESVVIVFNGEIYNFKELRAELEAKGHSFRTSTDTEVIVHAWEEWGSDCVQRLRGMFAFALYDKRHKVVLLSRDRIGIKPLYYSYDGNGRLTFASELKALMLDTELNRSIDSEAVEDYFAFGYIPDPKTIFRSVRKLEPGHNLIFNVADNTIRFKQYWNFSDRDSEVRSVDETGNELLERLEEAVGVRLVSDVPLGAFLSGGVDSSSVVAMMAGLREDPIRTTSIGFNEPQFDETEFAQRIADRYACDHRVERVTSDDLFGIDRLASLYDEPYADSSALPTYALCEATRQSVTVALSGDGGDELFAGYRGYRLHLNKEKIRGLLPRPVRKSVFGVLGMLYPQYDWMPKYVRAKTTFQTLARDSVDSYIWGSMITTESDRRKLFSKTFQSDLQGYTAFEVGRQLAKDAPVSDPMRLAQYLDFKLYLPGDILTKVDRASMAHGLEVRVPILDHHFVEWAFGLPADFKLRDGVSKYIFKHALKGHVDESILYRPKKGFSIPLAEWLKGPLKDRLDVCANSGHAIEAGIVSKKGFAELLAQFRRGDRDHSSLLWGMLLFECFLEKQTPN